MTWRDVVWPAIVMVPTLVGVVMGVRADLLLTNEQRNQASTVRMMQSSVRTIFTMGLMLCLMLLCLTLSFLSAFVTSGRSVWVPRFMSWWILPGAAVAVGWSHVRYIRTLRSLNLPPAYVRSQQVARFVAYSGWAVMLAWLVGSRSWGTS